MEKYGTLKTVATVYYVMAILSGLGGVLGAITFASGRNSSPTLAIGAFIGGVVGVLLFAGASQACELLLEMYENQTAQGEQIKYIADWVMMMKTRPPVKGKVKE